MDERSTKADDSPVIMVKENIEKFRQVYDPTGEIPIIIFAEAVATWTGPIVQQALKHLTKIEIFKESNHADHRTGVTIDHAMKTRYFWQTKNRLEKNEIVLHQMFFCPDDKKDNNEIKKILKRQFLQVQALNGKIVSKTKESSDDALITLMMSCVWPAQMFTHHKEKYIDYCQKYNILFR